MRGILTDLVDLGGGEAHEEGGDEDADAHLDDFLNVWVEVGVEN
jgi:hypothetical protein